MAVSVIPKSEFRRDENVIYGYGEVPAVCVEGPTGLMVMGWGLPGGEVTFSEREALKWAQAIDATIRRNMTSKAQLTFLE